jgi:hypothetical protein
MSFVVLALFGATAMGADPKKPAKVREVGEDHQREESGVNQFTTPSIQLILQTLRELRPVPYDKVVREIPQKVPGDRARIALSAGAVVADGFLAVIGEKQARIEPVGRALLAHAKALGVAGHVTKHARSILEHAARKEWDGVRAELVGTQRDVEKGMMDLKDEEIAHLVSLGGWLRGLEITGEIIVDSYTPERAALLVQPAVLDYFVDRIGTLNPRLRKDAAFELMEKNIREIRVLAVKEDRSPPALDTVKKVLALAKATNAALAKEE